MSNDSRELKRAEESIARFRKRFATLYAHSNPEGHYIFALQASFPLFFTPDLLYRLWQNFNTYRWNGETRNIDVLAVSDFLLSPLCREIGYEQYETLPTVGRLLRKEMPLFLDEVGQSVLGESRRAALAHFLDAYADRHYQHPADHNLLTVHQWTAQSVLDPSSTARNIVEKLGNSLERNDMGEALRLVLLAESFEGTAFREVNKLGEVMRQELKGQSGNKVMLRYATEEEANVSIHLPPSMAARVEQAQMPAPQIISGERAAEARIREAQASRLERLDLSGLNLQEIPVEVFELSWLKTLDMSHNRLRDLPDGLLSLKELEHLNVRNNPLPAPWSEWMRDDDCAQIYFAWRKNPAVFTAVCRVITEYEHATGFLLEGGYLITLQVYISSPEVAKKAKVEFGYELDASGKVKLPVTYRLDPSDFYTSPTEDLGITRVKVIDNPEEPLMQWGFLELSQHNPSKDDSLSIVYHGSIAGTKQFDDFPNSCISVYKQHFFYDLKDGIKRPGSSGAPVLDRQWQVVGVHQGAKTELDGGMVVDEKGTRMSARRAIATEAIQKWIIQKEREQQYKDLTTAQKLFLETIHGLIEENEIEKALDMLKELDKQSGADIWQDLALQNGNYRSAKKSYLEGRIDYSEFRRYEARAKDALTELMKSIPRSIVLNARIHSTGAFEFEIPDDGRLEKLIGKKSSLYTIDWLEKARKAANAVCRVVCTDGNVGTGFLVQGGYLFTNNHVIVSADSAKTARIEFNYETGKNAIAYELDASDFKSSQPRELDFTWVKVKDRPDAPLSQWGFLEIETESLPLIGEDVTIIQYYRGEIKKFKSEEIISQMKQYLFYTGETDGASSGAPVFNKDWKVVAIHHAGRTDAEGGLVIDEKGTKRGANRGILFREIFALIDSSKNKDVSPKLRSILGARSQLLKVNWLEGALRASKSVCRVVCADGSLGTGFITKDAYLFTCNHLINSVEVAKTAKIEFNYELDAMGKVKTPTVYNLDPSDFITSAPVNLDFTRVKVIDRADAPLSQWGYVEIDHQNISTQGENVALIQHPKGEPKRIALINSEVISIFRQYLFYTAATEPGSAGSPVFNKEWKVIAIHHAGKNLASGGLVVDAKGTRRGAKRGVLFRDIEQYIISGSLPEFDKDREFDNESSFEYVQSGTKDVASPDNLFNINYLDTALKASKAVCRVVCIDGNVGTGFITKEGYLFTTNYVIGSREVAQKARIEFNFELDKSGKVKVSTAYQLDANDFISSPVGNLDFTRVKVVDRSDAPLSQWGYVEFASEPFPEPGGPAIIVQHPKGEDKQLVLHNNNIISHLNQYLFYTSDTEPGSGGAPVFDKNMKVVAIHEGGKTEAEGGMVIDARGTRQGANRGILIHDILKYIREAQNLFPKSPNFE